jgi:hypothetical protein
MISFVDFIAQCTPIHRIWPQKCDRCIAKGQPCSEPMLANGTLVPPLLENPDLEAASMY